MKSPHGHGYSANGKGSCFSEERDLHRIPGTFLRMGGGGSGREAGEGATGVGRGDKAPPQALAPSTGSWCYSPKPPVPLSAHHGVPCHRGH